MSGQPEPWIELDFADGRYRFALTLPRINELQRRCGIGIGGLFKRLLAGAVSSGVDVIIRPEQGDVYILDIVETIRQGLIGGRKGVVDEVEIEVTDTLADQLVKNYVLDRPLLASWSLAASILTALIMGYDPPKKDQPPKEGAEPEPTA